MNTDGNLDALNRHLAEREAHDERREAEQELQDLRDEVDALVAKLATAREFVESFSLSCNQASFYKDCAMHFVKPHALSMRLPLDSSKSFIVADLEERRIAVLRALTTEGKDNE